MALSIDERNNDGGSLEGSSVPSEPIDVGSWDNKLPPQGAKTVLQWLVRDRGKNLGLLLLRLGFGAGMIYHGYGKVVTGAEGTIAFAASAGFPLPGFVGWAAALSEFLGGIGLMLGLLTRPSAFFITCTMSTAVLVRHADEPFGEKEKALAYLVAALCLLIAGAGTFSLDRYLGSKNEVERDWNTVEY